MNSADIWFIVNIIEELKKMYGIGYSKTKRIINNSNLFRLLEEMPEQVHHDSPKCWAKSLGEKNGLIEVKPIIELSESDMKSTAEFLRRVRE